MKKIRNMLMLLLCAAMLATAAGCAQQPATQATIPTAPAVSIPEDKAELDGSVIWCRGSKDYDDAIGYGGEWSLRVEDEAQWNDLAGEYGLKLEGEAQPDFSKYVILVLFYADYQGSEYELTELALKDGMATIGIHEKTQGPTQVQELVGCLVQLDEEPLEINSYRDEEAVG